MTSRLIWQRGQPKDGIFGGLLLGFGVTMILTQFSLVPLTISALVLGSVIGTAVGALRAWWGTAHRDTDEPPPPPPPPPPPS